MNSFLKCILKAINHYLLHARDPLLMVKIKRDLLLKNGESPAFVDLNNRAYFDFVAPVPPILCDGFNWDDVYKNISPAKL
jgi:hypothetical protein